MAFDDLISSLQHLGKDPSRLIFEDELTGLYNRRFLYNYFEHKVPWDELEDRTLSLIMMDLDYFKQINDAYGHQSGDQALVLVAGLLKEVAGKDGLPIRYAGDEFMILLPESPKPVAMEMSERLVERIHQQPLTVGGQTTLPLTLSIGVASAPDDAETGKALILKADTALYYAKKIGRDRFANASDLGLQEVFPKEAIYKLQGAKIAGRAEQLAQVAEALQKFSQRQNQFVLVEGQAGMGKTMFLDTIRQTLAQGDAAVVKVHGILQEGGRAYYLATNILLGLLSQLPDKGESIFQSLSPGEVQALAQVLPQLGGAEDRQPVRDEKVQRERVFAALLQFLTKVLNGRPLMVLVDDLQFADEGTLLLLRLLMLRWGVPLFICGTNAEDFRLEEQGELPPLDVFCASYCQELGISKVFLKPLTASDIASHLEGIFPRVKRPENFEQDLARVTQGNPLFLSEVVRKLILDQKITLVDQNWVITPLDEGYLPRSLEEIVSQKIAALDEESRQLLAQASAFGGDVSLSFLTGSSDQMEAKVLEFVDKARAVGLLSSDFELNDETIRFLGKRVLEITYGGIEQDRKQALHERIGNYHESLYQQQLLPSASYLAYHFKRSANQGKAIKYEQVQLAYNQRVFSAEEAAAYSGESPGEDPLPEAPLDAAGLAQVPVLVRSLQTAARNIRLYPPESKAILNANSQVLDALNQILATNERVNITQFEKTLLINGQKVDVGEFKFVAEAFLGFLSQVELQGLAFLRGVQEDELKVLLDAFGHIKPYQIDQRYWQRFSSEHHLTHINLKHVQYKERALRKERVSQVLAVEQKLEREELAQVHDIIRCFLSAARNIKLYPLKSNATSRAIEQLMDALQNVLVRRSVLTLARVGNMLLVNGDRVDTSEFKGLADGFLDFLKNLRLASVTFLESLTFEELQTFIGSFRQLPSTDLGSKYWKQFAVEQGLSSILFDERKYEIGVAATLKESGGHQPAEAGGDGPPAVVEVPETISEEEETARLADKEPFERYLESFSGGLLDLLLQGNTKRVQRMIQQLFSGFQKRDSATREKVVEVCRDSLKNLPVAFQPQYTKLAVDPLLAVFGEERDPRFMTEMASLLQRMATGLIQFSESLVACRIFAQLNARHRQLEDATDARAQTLQKVLDRKLEPATQTLLLEDLRSGDAVRQQNAAQVLSSLGRAGVPWLVEMIKQEESLRVRQIAAGLLTDQGPKAANVLKRELVTGSSPEERARILEVVDGVTRTLKTELAYALGDKNPQVCQAALRLAERLNDKQTVELLLDYAAHNQLELAIPAIRCLGRLKPAGIAETLCSLMVRTSDEDRVLAYCQALGLIADASSVKPLAGILAPKWWWFRRKEWSSQVRAAAAFALGQIPHAQAAQVLASFVNDRDPRVRQIAQKSAKQ